MKLIIISFYTLVSTSVIIISGCGENSPESFNINSFEKQYPLNYVSQLSRQIDYSLMKENHGDEVRLWTNVEMVKPKFLISLREVDSFTLKKNIRFWCSHPSGNNIFTLDSLFISSDRVSQNARAIIDTLYKHGLREVSSQGEESQVDDGITYVLEVRDNEYYKVIYCNTPEMFDDPNNRKLAEIICIAFREMGTVSPISELNMKCGNE